MAEELLPNDAAQNNEHNPQPEDGKHHHGRRRRVRKRIRIKKKTNPGKKLKKVAEKILWAVIIIGFIATLIIMVRQLNVVDEKNKKTKTSFMNSFSVSEIEFS